MFNKKAQGFIWIKVLFVGTFLILMFALALAPFMNIALGATNLTVLGSFGYFITSNLTAIMFTTLLLVLLIALIYGFNSE